MEIKINYLPLNFKESKYGIKMSGKTEYVIKALQDITNEKGYFNAEILKRKEAGKYGETHYAKEDTWKPELKTETQYIAAKSTQVEESDLPF